MTQDQSDVDLTAEAVEIVEAPTKVNCRHCGQPFDGEVGADGDFLCLSCDHYQDLMSCPTCGAQVRISTMPADMHPEVHAPARRKKEKQ